MNWLSERIYYHKWVTKFISLTVSWRSKKSIMGRFGGGWNWKVGVQCSDHTALFSLLVLEVTITIHKEVSNES